MDTAAEWAAISPHTPNHGESERATCASMVTNLSWSQLHQAHQSAAPLFGSRRAWFDYAYETTGYGSLELCSTVAYRVTIVQPGDAQALRRHHLLVRSGHLRPALHRRRHESSGVHVIDRDELCRTRADDPGSWLAEAQGIARLCGVDDAVARLAGSSLRRLLWFGREHLDTECVGTALADLGRATESLAAARGSYHAAVERMAFASERWACGTQAQLEVVDQLAQEDVHSINLEVRALAEVQAEWEGHTSSAGR